MKGFILPTLQSIKHIQSNKTCAMKQESSSGGKINTLVIIINVNVNAYFVVILIKLV